MTELALRVSQAQTQLRALERAVHADDAWEMVVGGLRAPAERFVHEGGVCFEAFVGTDLPEDVVLGLLHDGQLVLVAEFQAPATFDGWVSWDLSLEDRARL